QPEITNTNDQYGFGVAITESLLISSALRKDTAGKTDSGAAWIHPYNCDDCCPEKFAGTYCDECASDFFGDECQYECDACVHGSCATTDDSCWCGPGWDGTLCGQCAMITFSSFCFLCYLHCQHGECDYEEHTCVVDERYSGLKCDECDDGYHGEDCVPDRD